MSIDEIPENSSNESSNRRADKGGYSPLLVGFLILGSVIGVRACNHARRTHERERESEIRHTQMMNDFYQKLGEDVSENYNRSIVPLEENDEEKSLDEIYKEIDRLEKKAGLGKYEDSK